MSAAINKCVQLLGENIIIVQYVHYILQRMRKALYMDKYCVFVMFMY